MKTKICTKCKGDPKPLSEFHKLKSGKYGLMAECKKCNIERKQEYYHTIPGFISRLYNSQIQHSKRRRHPPPTYTKTELLQLALISPLFLKLFKQWVESGYKTLLKPSFDRENDYKPYTLDNFNKWMTWEKNNSKGNEDRKNGINNKQSIAVIGIHKVTGENVKYYSMMEAQRQTGIRYSDISRCCLGKAKTAGGFIWKIN